MVKLLALVASLLLAAAPAGNSLPPQPVVVELFTSEGCSSCPPADQLLTSLANSKENSAIIIPLGFHVDYWDDGGWKDRFSSHRYTARQEQYSGRFRLNSVYTPQMVIDGRKQIVGNEDAAVRDAIRRAAGQPKPARVTITAAPGDMLAIAVEMPPPSSNTVNPVPAEADVLLAITEDELTTAVKGGENTSRTLHHSAVVRELRAVGSVTNGKFAGGVPLALDREWQRDHLHAIVLVQQRDHGAILGAAQASLAGAR